MVSILFGALESFADTTVVSFFLASLVGLFCCSEHVSATVPFLSLFFVLSPATKGDCRAAESSGSFVGELQRYETIHVPAVEATHMCLV